MNHPHSSLTGPFGTVPTTGPDVAPVEGPDGAVVAGGPDGSGGADDAETDAELSRRTLMRRAGIGGGVLLAASVLNASPAFAQQGGQNRQPTVPDPSRAGRTPQRSNELATKGYVDTAVSTAGNASDRVAKAGDTMTGMLLLPSTTPTQDNHATRKAYVDTQRDTRVAKAGDTMTGTLTLSGAPSSSLHAATKSYVDTTVAAASGTQGGTAGGVKNELFFENDVAATADYTIGTRGETVVQKNAMSAGPITISDGVTITVPDGAVWTVV